ncbi:MAG: hypothetical protein QM680_09565 [Luteolibacter sp.]
MKPQWVETIEQLKLSGGLPVSELARRLGASYMAVKQYCEDLKDLGYLERTRLPRTEVGRPEILYRLTAKADALFPQAGAQFSLDLLEQVRALFGENAPERLIFQYFQSQQEQWKPKLTKAKSLVEKATLLAALREKAGSFGRCRYDAEKGFRIEEYHHPLEAVFIKYPRAILMEVRMLEQLLGTRVNRVEIPGGKHGPARVDYEVATLGH